MRSPIDRGAISALTGDLATLGDPIGPDSRLALLRTLYAVGRRDLPLGRLFEGHVDALQIVSRYGTPAQWTAAQRSARAGAVFGVWNADHHTDPLQMADRRLSGSKAFASGAGILTHAIVTVGVAGGRQLLLLDLVDTPLEIDRSWWQVTGMQRSETHLVRWNAVPVTDSALIDGPDDYLREPWFAGGALRFAAVQAGGVAGVVDLVRNHLVEHHRAEDPYQVARLADLYLAAQSAANAVSAAGSNWLAEDGARTLAYVAAARTAVYTAGEAVLTAAQAAVGVSAMFVDHPLSQMLTDLTVYLRQPGPDGQRSRTGTAVAQGLLSPSL